MVGHGLLVVGASHAGTQLAVSLRDLGYTSPITVIDGSSHEPHHRPPLSKDFLLGRTDSESLLLRSEGFWREQDITMLLGETVISIEMLGGGAGIARSRSGRTYRFDRLALAVGARARPLVVLGAAQGDIAYLRDVGDALQLRSRWKDCAKVVVVGGGFIGLEVAASAAAAGKSVTVLEAGPRLLGRAVGAAVAERVLRHHRGAGIEINLDSTIHSVLTRNGRATAVIAGEEVIAADLVVAGVGVVPNTELAQSIGLACDDGVCVDEDGLTSDGFTIAVGDCTRQPAVKHAAQSPAHIRLESVNNAVDQAKAAARTLVGDPAEERSLPWFWSRQGDLTIQIVGLTYDHDHVVNRNDDSSGRLTTLYYVGADLVAAECVNSPAEFVALRAAIARRDSPPVELAADLAVPLREALRGTTRCAG